MGMTRLDSHGLLPNSNYAAVTPSLPDTNPHAISATALPAQRALFTVPAANTGTITITIGGKTLTTFASGAFASYLLESGMGHTFDLAQISATGSLANQVLNVFYQP